MQRLLGNRYGYAGLTDNGANLSSADFVSFTYNGSNLFGSYTILPTNPGFFISGSIPGTLPSPATVDIENNNFFFFSNGVGNNSGLWSTGIKNGTTVPSDHGINGVYSNAATTPEPTTYAMLGAALIGLVIFRRKIISAL